jgi:acyl dehydratase
MATTIQQAVRKLETEGREAGSELINGDGQGQKFFEDLREGYCFEKTILITEAMVSAFSELSGDNNSFHRKRVHGVALATIASGVVSEFLGSSSSTFPTLTNMNVNFTGQMGLGDNFMVVGKTVNLEGSNGKRGTVSFELKGFDGRGREVINALTEIIVPTRHRES